MRLLKWLKFKILNQKRKLWVFSRFPGVFSHRNCVFIHIPKAAGSSVAMAIYGCQVGHASYKEIYSLDKEKAENCFSFTIVRNPIDRFVSAYNFLKGGGLNQSDKQYSSYIFSKYKDINEFIDDLDVDKIQQLKHFIPQHKFVCDDNGIIQVDFIGRLENIESSMEYVSKQIGFDINLKKLNRTGIKEKTDISQESIKKLGYLYEKDFELFGYKIT